VGKWLEDLFATLDVPHVALVPIAEDAATLYETSVGWGGEGIVLKEPTSIYRPGFRSPAWLKVKPKVTLDIVVTDGSSEPIQWGDWGLAVMLEIAYTHLGMGRSCRYAKPSVSGVTSRLPCRLENGLSLFAGA
jgi:ATP-dependent DNA ligase